jgi:hypothetical protein
MIAIRRIATTVAGLLIVSCMLACGVGKVREAAARAQRTNDLKQIGLSYHSFYDDKKRGPKDSAELQAFVKDPDAQKVIALSAPGGQYVIIWNVKIGDMARAGGLSTTVLGYESTAPTQGGLVLMVDGSVKQMNAQEFNAAPKASPAEKK